MPLDDGPHHREPQAATLGAAHLTRTAQLFPHRLQLIRRDAAARVRAVNIDRTIRLTAMDFDARARLRILHRVAQHIRDSEEQKVRVPMNARQRTRRTRQRDLDVTLTRTRDLHDRLNGFLHQLREVHACHLKLRVLNLADLPQVTQQARKPLSLDADAVELPLRRLIRERGTDPLNRVLQLVIQTRHEPMSALRLLLTLLANGAHLAPTQPADSPPASKQQGSRNEPQNERNPRELGRDRQNLAAIKWSPHEARDKPHHQRRRNPQQRPIQLAAATLLALLLLLRARLLGTMRGRLTRGRLTRGRLSVAVVGWGHDRRMRRRLAL